MPSVQTQPQGHTTRTFIEGHHFGPLWGRRKVVRFGTDVPADESPNNLRYVDMEEKYSRTGTSRKIHESKVHIGQDMFLVSGYWDPKADVNRSVLALTDSIWRGEISVVRAGKYIPYHKRMKDGPKADLAVKRFVQVFKHRKSVGKLVPRTILG